MQRSITRPSAINLYGMPIEPRDSHTNRNYIVTAGALKNKLRFYFANVIVNDDVLREIEEIFNFASRFLPFRPGTKSAEENDLSS